MTGCAGGSGSGVTGFGGTSGGILGGSAATSGHGKSSSSLTPCQLGVPGPGCGWPSIAKWMLPWRPAGRCTGLGVRSDGALARGACDMLIAQKCRGDRTAAIGGPGIGRDFHYPARARGSPITAVGSADVIGPCGALAMHKPVAQCPTQGRAVDLSAVTAFSRCSVRALCLSCSDRARHGWRVGTMHLLTRRNP